MAGSKEVSPVNNDIAELDDMVVREAYSGSSYVPVSWDDVIARLGGDTITSSDDIVDEWPLIDKSRLVNVEFMAYQWSVSKPENETYGAPYVVVRGVKRDGGRFRFTDGSTGVCQQLIAEAESRFDRGVSPVNMGYHFKGGLRASTYKAKDAAGNTIEATTYYITTNY